MNRLLNGVARALIETFDLPAPILEIGSYQVRGQEEIADLRALLPGKDYTGLDARPGPGVDLVADAQALPHADASVGTVIAMNALEHVPRFWRVLDEIHRVLRPDGAVLLSCPFYFRIHSYPSDYWRFTPEALKLVLEDYPHQVIGWHGPPRRPANVWALAFREQAEPITPERFAEYRSRLWRYARQPMSWGKRLRYRLGRWLCGRQPFAPYLDQERWESECRTR
ncbi:MAG TPA: class I SAM-dependent methyltransferase [Gemmataceae bacterium]|nr:class I SAM-dependent methyltransferase [Gemmataceae bacterium]